MIEVEDGGSICFDRYVARPKLGAPVLYLASLNGPNNEAKSTKLKAWCRKNGSTFIAADYFGVGRSSGNFADGSVSRWASDTIQLMEKALVSDRGSKVILVGHGVGAWISFVVALRRPDLVRGIVGISADPDFTEELLWKKLPEEVKTKIMTEGVADVTWGNQVYPISRTLIEDGRNNLMLAGGPNSVDVRCPVRLLHGLRDEEVPFECAFKLAQNIKSSDVKVVLLKSSTHSFEDFSDMRTMIDAVQELVDAFVGEYDLRSPGSG